MLARTGMPYDMASTPPLISRLFDMGGYGARWAAGDISSWRRFQRSIREIMAAASMPRTPALDSADFHSMQILAMRTLYTSPRARHAAIDKMGGFQMRLPLTARRAVTGEHISDAIFG